MKTELKLMPHAIIPGANVVEIWYGGMFLGTVVGADGPGVRVISKHRKEIQELPMIVQVNINPLD